MVLYKKVVQRFQCINNPDMGSIDCKTNKIWCSISSLVYWMGLRLFRFHSTPSRILAKFTQLKLFYETTNIRCWNRNTVKVITKCHRWIIKVMHGWRIIGEWVRTHCHLCIKSIPLMMRYGVRLWLRLWLGAKMQQAIICVNGDLITLESSQDQFHVNP